MFLDDYTAAIARRLELLETIAECADELARIDRRLPILRGEALEADLIQAEPSL